MKMPTPHDAEHDHEHTADHDHEHHDTTMITNMSMHTITHMTIMPMRRNERGARVRTAGAKAGCCRG